MRCLSLGLGRLTARFERQGEGEGSCSQAPGAIRPGEGEKDCSTEDIHDTKAAEFSDVDRNCVHSRF